MKQLAFEAEQLFFLQNRQGRFLQGGEQFAVFARLGHEPRDPQFDSPQQIGDIGKGAVEHHRGIRTRLVQVLGQGDAVHLRHDDVGEYKVGFFPAEKIQGLAAVGAEDYPAAMGRQEIPHGLSQELLVFYKQQCHMFKCVCRHRKKVPFSP